MLPAEAGRDPYDRALSDLIGELSTRSEEFRVRWAAHNVKFHRTGVKRLHHPLVGELTLTYEAFELPADTGQRMLVYTAEPDSPSHGFRLLDELAGLIGGGVGCSRVVTNTGWRPHADQIGQTGARIAPEIYIACGISGATQHMVGARGAKRILVINTDRDAPIMTHANYAVIGDLHQVVPALIDEVRGATGG